jgi:Zn-dependent peptidase ImmA (M78 family)
VTGEISAGLRRREIVAASGIAKEIEANQFAASLLMPVELLKASVRRHQGRLRDDHVSRLAIEYVVSERAMTIRLSVLRLL